MDKVFLSRLQFALTAMYHFLFVPLTLGLGVIIAWMETRYVRTGEDTYQKMAKFWGKLFVINFVLGVVTGITLEFQFGMNWAAFSGFVGDIFGAPLAIEATVAFFLESTFLGLWIFGWNRISLKMHALSIWIVAIASNLSALWILLANGWMQHPVGYRIVDGRAVMTDFWAVATNTYGWLKFFHTVLAGFVVGGFFVLGISAYHLLKDNWREGFRRSFRMAASFTLISSVLLFVVGDFHASHVAKTQPTKFAAMESVWQTQRSAPYYLLVLPDEAKEKNAVELIGIPKMLSFLAYHDFNAEVKGLRDFPPDERPPVLITFLGFRSMIGLGMLFMFLGFIAFLLSRGWLRERDIVYKVFILSIPLPYIATQLGWIVAEVGRQPWLVYGLVRTSEGVSKVVSRSQVVFSLTGFVLIYSLLAAVDVYLLCKFARKVPHEEVKP